MEREIVLTERYAAALSAASRFLLELVNPTKGERRIAEEINCWCRGIVLEYERIDSNNRKVLDFLVLYWINNDPNSHTLVEVVLKSFQKPKTGPMKDSWLWRATYLKMFGMEIAAEVEYGNWAITIEEPLPWWVEYLRESVKD